MSASRIRRSLSVVTGLLFAALIAGLAVGPVAAQTMPGQSPGLVASGWGRASAPAGNADVQLIISPGYYGGYGMIEPSIEGEAVASPAAETDSGMMMDPYAEMMGAPAPLTEADLAPITEAIVAGGVAGDQIEVLIPAFTSMYTGGGGPESAQIRFSIADPDVAALTAILQEVRTAASGAGLSIEHFGVRYSGADCAALEQEALTAAVADARANAERLAVALGGELGALVQAADGSFFGYESIGCSPEMPDEFGPYGDGTEPAFDPSKPAEVVVYTQVTLTYELPTTGEATPTA
jgi:uncharacterized protein YggE